MARAKPINSGEQPLAVPITSAIAPTVDWVQARASDHFVQFYEEPAHLYDSVAAYLAEGLSSDTACIVLAASAHLRHIEQRLTAHGIDLQIARERHQYVVLDGEESLKQLLRGDDIDRNAFFELIGSTVQSATACHRQVRAFGELVALLCRQGKYEAAQQLEQLWNELIALQPFSLYCAYPMSCFESSQQAAAFTRTCALHHRAIPTEHYAVLSSTEARLEEISKLQQKAHALENEIEARKAIAHRLANRERELQDFLDNASEAFRKVDAQGKILWANQAELDMLGYSAEEYINKQLAAFYVDGEDTVALLRRILSGETLRNEPAQMRCKNGAIMEVLVSCNSYREDGQFLYTRCFTRDVTLERRARHLLQEEAQAWEILNRTGNALASELDLEKLTQTITDAAVVLTRAEFGAFFKKTADQYSLYSLSGASPDALAQATTAATKLFAAAFENGRSIHLDDSHHHPACQSDYDDDQTRDPLWNQMQARSYLAVPIATRAGEVHGSLLLGHAKPNAFSRTDELIVGGIASQAAIAIDNASLFKAGQQAQEQLRLLNETLEQRIQERSAALRHSEFQFSRLVEGVTDYAIYMLSPEGVIVSWNMGAERIKGYSREEIIGKHFSLFYTAEDRSSGEPQRALATARTTGKYEAESWRVRKDGTRFWANVLVDALHDDKGELLGFAKVTRDMTERRKLEEKFHQSQKMEAIGQLTGGVAHDFNNLLTVIVGNLETIARQAPPDNRRLRDAADNATRGAQRAATLTQQLLAFSRRQTLNPKPTDINQLVVGMSNLLCHTLGENIAIETVLAGGLWPAEVDAHQLENAIINLAVNARDAMHDKGGKLTISTGNAEIAAADLAVAGDLAPGRYVLISVSDTGIGMTPEVAARAFEPFFTTKPLGHGTGLGLSQAYGFVKQSGGHIKIYSAPNEGTTIAIYLQRAGKCKLAAMESETEPVVVPRSKGHETILVVEDDRDVRQYSTESLRDLGFTVLEAPEATTALRMLDDHPEIRLLFTDVGLPGLNGRELVEQARARRPELKVLFTTGYARDVIKGHLKQGIELLPKPFTRVELANRVRAALDSTVVRAEHRPTALVVDDEALVAQFLADTLEDLGFRVVQAGTATEAIDAASAPESLAVALVDLGLPDRSGLELIAELKKLRPRLPVLIATGYGAMAQRDAAETNRPSVVLAKPYNAQAISQALGELGVIVPRRLLN